MLISIILLLIGFVILIKGADFLIDGASSFAKKMSISEIAIGLTIKRNSILAYCNSNGIWSGFMEF
jgi:Ca2+/Na+ antiporter